jgi:hypothetical protein
MCGLFYLFFNRFIMKIKILAFFVIIILACNFKTARAQVVKPDSIQQVPHAYWLAGGLGGSSRGIELMSNANAELGHKWLVTGTAQIESAAFGSGEDVEQFNVLGGKIFKEKASLFSVSAGLGIVYINKATVGIPVLFQVYLVGGQFIGIGLNACANLNPTEPTAGFSINIALGRMATRRK